MKYVLLLALALVAPVSLAQGVLPDALPRAVMRHLQFQGESSDPVQDRLI